MNDADESNTSDLMEDVKIKRALSKAQRDAVEQAFILNHVYPNRWFTLCELNKVIPVTMEALILRGYIRKRISDANPKVTYYQYTGLPFDDEFISMYLMNHKK